MPTWHNSHMSTWLGPISHPHPNPRSSFIVQSRSSPTRAFSSSISASTQGVPVAGGAGGDATCHRAAAWVTQVCGWVAATRSLRPRPRPRPRACARLPPLPEAAPTHQLPTPPGSRPLHLPCPRPSIRPTSISGRQPPRRPPRTIRLGIKIRRGRSRYPRRKERSFLDLNLGGRGGIEAWFFARA
jgi:hypothetical protein